MEVETEQASTLTFFFSGKEESFQFQISQVSDMVGAASMYG
jgi:hypothetical protein